MMNLEEIKKLFEEHFKSVSNTGKVFITFSESDIEPPKLYIPKMNFNCFNCGSNDIQDSKCQHCQTNYKMPVPMFMDLSTKVYSI